MNNKPAKKIHKDIKINKFGTDVHPVLKAINEMVDFIKPTLGPKVHHVLVDMGWKTELMDDGTSIAQEFELDDPFENAVIQYVKEVAKKTDDRAGDGTTTTMVLLQALLKEMINAGKTYPEMVTELDKGVKECIDQLNSKTKKIESVEDLYMVAKTSFNDEDLARLVAKTIYEIGPKGAVTITDWIGKGVETQRVEGFIFPRGYIARGFINDKDRQMFISPEGKVAIKVVDEVLQRQEDVLPILEEAEKAKVKNLLIVCNNLIGEALGVVAQMKVRGLFNICAVPLPGQGEKVKDYIQDINTITGAVDGGFGFADRIEVSKDDTAIIGGSGNKEEVQKLITFLQTRVEEMKEEYDREYFYQRQARLQQGIVIIKVGGITDTEINLKLKKIEDAVNATKCALEEGVVPGAGMTLKRLQTSSPILNSALPAVFNQVLANSEAEMPEAEMKDGETLDVVSMTVGDFLKVGVVDATKVLRTAIENAVSIAKILFSISGIITSKPDDSKKD